MYIAIDPGASEKGNTGITGYATFTPEGVLMDMEYLTEQEIKPRFLTDIKENSVETVIIEDWQMRPEMAQRLYWSRMPTSKLIGWLEGVCDLGGIRYVLQGASIKSVGYKHWGKKPLPKSNPMNHAYDAVVHGREFLIKQRIIRA